MHPTKQANRVPFFIFSLLISISGFISSCSDDSDAADPQTSADKCLTTQSVNHGEVIPGEYIVSFGTDTSPAGRKASAARTFERHRIPSERIIDEAQGELSTYVLKLSQTEAAALKNDRAVSYIESDRIISICACFTVKAPSLITWNVDNVGYGDGTGTTAWILDTGIDYSHPDLLVDKERSISFVAGITSADDDNGHGTHIAGIIGAKNNTIGTLGVASGASLIGLKILDANGDGRLSYAIKALTHVQSRGSAGDVVNISMSLEDISDILDKEIIGVADRDIYVTIAAGNEAKLASTFSPARTSGKNIYTVSAVDSLNNFASFSNYGNDAVDFAAPGVRVPSTYLDGKYAYMSGTSMAAPHVAGILLINKGKVNSKGSAQGDPDGNPDPLAHN
jgi:subtilisin